MLGLFKRKPKRPTSFKYRRCPNCNALAWEPRGRGEIVERWGDLIARQYHHCLSCGIRMNLVRLLDSETWSRTMEEAYRSK